MKLTAARPKSGPSRSGAIARGRAWEHAEANAENLLIRAPIEGLVVLRTIWKGGRLGEPQEGEEVRTGLGLLDVVAEGEMRVRVKLNQSDLPGMAVGLPAEITLDAYPNGATAGGSNALRPWRRQACRRRSARSLALFSVQNGDSTLTPDLSAAVDVRLGSWADALTVPRRALTWRDGVGGRVGRREVARGQGDGDHGSRGRDRRGRGGR